MTRVLFDIDVLLEVIEERAPHVDASSGALSHAEVGIIRGYIAAHSLPTVFYLVDKQKGRDAAYEAIRLLIRLLEVVAVDHDRLTQALDLGWSDFEDALQARCASHAGVDVLLTRNTKDYKNVGFAVEDPERFLARPEFLPPPDQDTSGSD
ncbi:MAG: PIN domain-containing protein [Gemmatimonadota bacterium]